MQTAFQISSGVRVLAGVATEMNTGEAELQNHLQGHHAVSMWKNRKCPPQKESHTQC